MSDSRKELQEMLDVRDAVLPLVYLQHQIERDTRIKPTAVMLPLSLAPEAHTVWGLPVIRGDRTALIYAPPRPKTEARAD
jgi:hypothetical protein